MQIRLQRLELSWKMVDFCREDMSRTTICSRHHRTLMNMISMWMYFMISSSTWLMVHKRETIAINMAR